MKKIFSVILLTFLFIINVNAEVSVSYDPTLTVALLKSSLGIEKSSFFIILYLRVLSCV